MNSGNVTYNLDENFIEQLSERLYRDYFKKGKDLSKMACVFGGKRPALFLNRSLARKIKKSFLPPRFFSIDEFLEYVIDKYNPLAKITDLDAAFKIYKITGRICPDILENRNKFDDFLSWANEITSFINQLDIERIDDSVLESLRPSAEIGYEVPENINFLLQNIVKIRNHYHDFLYKNNLYSRGFLYLTAAEKMNEVSFPEFEKIFFCNFYYLSRTENIILKSLKDKGKASFIFQGNKDKWSVLKTNSKKLNIPIEASKENKKSKFELQIYKGTDMHSQIGLIRDTLKKISPLEDTVVVVPRPEAVIPLLSEASSCLQDFNVSIGYPIARTPVYTLFKLLFKAQENKKGKRYYSRDYLSLLKHPLVKNLKIAGDSAVTRILVHKIEEALQGYGGSGIGGTLFVSLSEIENERSIYKSAVELMSGFQTKVSKTECVSIVKELHRIFFKRWQEINNIFEFTEHLLDLCNDLVDRSMIWKFPFNLKGLEKLYSVIEDFQSSSFSYEKFSPLSIWDIFNQKLQSVMIPFSGSPLKGLQILGLYETRSLNFKNVIIMDMNESVLPKSKIYEPLIPREVMLNLGLNRLEKEEEIQRYQFMRLISGADNVYLVYEENQEKEKSRFIEELLWNKQIEQNKLIMPNIKKAGFEMKIKPAVEKISKNKKIAEHLTKQIYSASRLNVYLNCPVQFYYRYVLGIKENEDLLEGIESPHIGTFIHEFLEEAFSCFVGSAPVVDENFSERFFQEFNKKYDKEIKSRMKAESLLLKRVISVRLKRFLEKEAERKTVKILGLEEETVDSIVINGNEIKFRYTADRIDELPDKKILVIDYKTGGSNIAPKNMKSLTSMNMNRD